MKHLPTKVFPLGVSIPPYDAAVEYVATPEAASVSVRTGIRMVAGRSFELTLSHLSTLNSSYWRNVLGTKYSKSRAAFYVKPNSSIDNSAVNLDYGNTVYGLVAQSVNTTTQVRIGIGFDGARTYGYVGASKKYVNQVVFPDTNNSMICIIPDYQILSFRIYALKVWDTDGSLLFDGSPCRVGTAGALYDRVSGTLYYSATSTALIPGPDLP